MLATLAVPGLALGVLGVEVVLAARQGPHPHLQPPVGGIDGCSGCGTLAGAPLRLLVAGDSTAAGVGVDSPSGTFAWLLATRLHRPIEVRSVAVSGARTADVRDRQVPAAKTVVDKGFAPEVIIVSIGANDVTHLGSPGTVAAAHRTAITSLAALAPSAQVVVIGVPDMGSPPRFKTPLRQISGFFGRRMDRSIRDAVADEGATYVDIAGATGQLFRRDRSLFARDGFHPGPTGYAAWADAIAPSIR